jgi:uncharacterized protein (DUF427 family)
MKASDLPKRAAHAVGAHRITTRPSARQVRVEHDGEVLAESSRALELDETGLPTRYYLPREDVRVDVLAPSETTSHCPFKGDATYRTLQVGDRVVPNALWAYPDPVDAAPWLAGYASLYWEAADAWYDEDELIHGLADPFHRVDVRSTGQHVQVLAGDTVVAETRSPLVLSETGLPNRYYLTPEDVRVPLAPTATRTHCPYKGDAGYWSVRLPDGTELADAAWGYPEPLPESARIAGRVSFLHEGLRVLVDGEPR